jgi:hypothetical protein
MYVLFCILGSSHTFTQFHSLESSVCEGYSQSYIHYKIILLLLEPFNILLRRTYYLYVYVYFNLLVLMVRHPQIFLPQELVCN